MYLFFFGDDWYFLGAIKKNEWKMGGRRDGRMLTVFLITIFSFQFPDANGWRRSSAAICILDSKMETVIIYIKVISTATNDFVYSFILQLY